MKFACVTTNVLDLRAEPSWRSERLSQALFGEPVRVIQIREGFARIEQVDGYRGWADIRRLDQISATAHRQFSKAKPGKIKTTARLLIKPGGQPAFPYLLYYSTPVWINRKSQGFVQISLANSQRFYLSSRNVLTMTELNNARPSGQQVVAEARRFLGVPYLWGGVTNLGWDCSGMVRAVLGRFGIEIPRDTKDQIRVGEQVDRSETRTGDLVFFDRHVGFAIGRHRLIHATMGGGGVRVNSLRPGDDNYREDLHNDYLQTRRIL